MKPINLRACAASCTLAVLVLTSTTLADVIYVKWNAPSGGDGSSWADAFRDLHDGLDAAQPGDEIWVAQGTYKPAPPGGNQAVSFEMRPGVALYGGFDGSETSLDQRDWVAHPTILSGDLNGDDGPNFTNVSDNSDHVVNAYDLSSTAVLDGFVVERGYGFDDEEQTAGGGVHARLSNVELANCTFRLCGAELGGAVRIRDCMHALIDNCVIEDNLAAFGAGVTVHECGWMEVQDTTFRGNVASTTVGAMYVGPSDGFHPGAAIFTNCTIIANVSGFVTGDCCSTWKTRRLSAAASYETRTCTTQERCSCQPMPSLPTAHSVGITVVLLGTYPQLAASWVGLPIAIMP